MRYVAAYLLAILGGNESPTSKDLKKILDSVGIETDDERVNKVMILAADHVLPKLVSEFKTILELLGSSFALREYLQILVPFQMPLYSDSLSNASYTLLL